MLILVAMFPPPKLLPQENQIPLLTREQCEDLALKNSPLIHDASQDIGKQQARLTRAHHAGILPKSELRNVWGPIPRQRGEFTEFGWLVSPDKDDELNEWRYFTQLEINLEQPIYAFGKYSSKTRAAKFDLEAAEAKLAQRQAETLLQVRQLYWGLVLGREIQHILEDAQQELQKAEDKLEEKLDAGDEDVSQTDLFKLDMFKYEINKRQREAEERVTMAKSTLAKAIGMQADEFSIADEILEPVIADIDSLQAYIALALENRADLVQQHAKTSSRLAQVDAELSQKYPQFFVGAATKFNFAKDRFDPKNPFVVNSTNYFRPNPYFQVRQKLNFWHTKDDIRLARAEYEQASQETQKLEGEIRLEVAEVYAKLQRARAKIHQSRRALKASENWLRSTSMTFDIGVGNVKDLIDAYQANSAMKAEHVRNIFEFNTALAELSQATGVDLLADLRNDIR